MFEFAPITQRVSRIREKYRSVTREIDTSRYRLVTEFYRDNYELFGIMRRALNLKNICENIVIRIEDDEIIVGSQTGTFGACALYPETKIDWLLEEIKAGTISTRQMDPYKVSEEDAKYILETGEFWHKRCPGNMAEAWVSEGYFPYAGNGLSNFQKYDRISGPVGHFCADYRKIIHRGVEDIKAEADAKIKKLEEEGVRGDSAQHFHFYRAVSICCDAMLILNKRYAILAQEMYEKETRPERKAELGRMVEALNWCFAKPARTFQEALQAMFMYHTCVCLDANMHGISWGRLDQYLGEYYDRDIAEGHITPEEGQELLDLFYLKVAEMNKPWSEVMTQSNPGYTSGQLMTLGGVDENGDDATNAVTYMMLQSMGRMFLHDPPQAMRIHKGTPNELWEAALTTNRRCGGVPSFENDEVIIPTLMEKRGFTLEDARDYCGIGCVEPGGCGNDWPCCGGPAGETYWNLSAGLWLAMNNGISTSQLSWHSTKHMEDAIEADYENQVGVPCGFLYEMESFDELLAAFEAQIKFFAKWHMTNSNLFEPIMQHELPAPVISATMEGCMEKGLDVMFGGAKYQSVGVSSVGIGNCADSLHMIKHLCFDEKICTTRELFDALKANWEGYEELHDYVRFKAPHYGNGDPEVDQWVGWVSDLFAGEINKLEGPYCHYNAGTFPVTTNVVYGLFTPATPDGRKAGEPLSDGISPVQATDKNGPTATLQAVSHLDCSQYANGTLLNMKFHPTVLANEDSVTKLVNLLETYFFKMNGMEMQINIVSADTLRDAQDKPKDYNDLVVRVAGFSTFFVQMTQESQNDLISRTEHAI